MESHVSEIGRGEKEKKIKEKWEKTSKHKSSRENREDESFWEKNKMTSKHGREKDRKHG
jgi:hypothetical protein